MKSHEAILKRCLKKKKFQKTSPEGNLCGPRGWPLLTLHGVLLGNVEATTPASIRISQSHRNEWNLSENPSAPGLLNAPKKMWHLTENSSASSFWTCRYFRGNLNTFVYILLVWRMKSRRRGSEEGSGRSEECGGCRVTRHTLFDITRRVGLFFFFLPKIYRNGQFTLSFLLLILFFSLATWCQICFFFFLTYNYVIWERGCGRDFK